MLTLLAGFWFEKGRRAREHRDQLNSDGIGRPQLAQDSGGWQSPDYGSAPQQDGRMGTSIGARIDSGWKPKGKVPWPGDRGKLFIPWGQEKVVGKRRAPRRTAAAQGSHARLPAEGRPLRSSLIVRAAIAHACVPMAAEGEAPPAAANPPRPADLPPQGVAAGSAALNRDQIGTAADRPIPVSGIKRGSPSCPPPGVVFSIV